MKNCQPFGTYACGPGSRLLLTVTRLGLSRGKIRRLMTRAWNAKGCEIVDLELRGVRYRLHVRQNTTDNKLLTSSKVYDAVEIKTLARAIEDAPGREGVFVDVGANTGYYALAMWKHGAKRVLAIEPNPVTLGMLRQNIELNAAQDVIHVAPYCVAEAGEMDFFVSKGLGNASLLRSNHPDAQAIRVPAKPLIDILNEHGIQQIDAMKVDIEGFEDVAMMPFFDQNPPTRWPTTMVIEHCNAGDWSTNVIDHLKAKGYTQIGLTRANTLLRRAGEK